MKKFLTILMAVICVFSLCAVGFAASAAEADESARSSASAPPVSVGYDGLLNHWTVTAADNGKKYAFYSPVIDANDTTKYPVVIYIHGLFHGWTDKSFVKNGLVYWCGREMQDKFREGGAHLIAPKIPELTITSAYDDEVMGIIKDYVSQNINNVDTEQIYIMGGSAGGGLAWKLIINNPDYFAKGVLLCATGIVSADKAKKAANVPVWEVSANTDPLVNILFQTATWNNVAKHSNVKDRCRWTRFSGQVTCPDGSHPFISHFLAKTIGYNFCTVADKKMFSGMSTVNGNGESVALSWDNSIVEWLQS